MKVGFRIGQMVRLLPHYVGMPRRGWVCGYRNTFHYERGSLVSQSYVYWVAVSPTQYPNPPDVTLIPVKEIWKKQFGIFCVSAENLVTEEGCVI